MKKCLECQNEEESCICSDGFKVIFFCGRALTKEQMENTPTFEQAKETVKVELEKISRLMKELKIK